MIVLKPITKETDVIIYFNDGFDKIANLDQLKIQIANGSYVEKIIVSTTFFPVPGIFPPNVNVEIRVNILTNQTYKLSEQALSNKTITVDLLEVSNDKRIIQANSVNVNEPVKILFVDNIGLLESN